MQKKKKNRETFKYLNNFPKPKHFIEVPILKIKVDLKHTITAKRLINLLFGNTK